MWWLDTAEGSTYQKWSKKEKVIIRWQRLIDEPQECKLACVSDLADKLAQITEWVNAVSDRKLLTHHAPQFVVYGADQSVCDRCPCWMLLMVLWMTFCIKSCESLWTHGNKMHYWKKVSQLWNLGTYSAVYLPTYKMHLVHAVFSIRPCWTKTHLFRWSWFAPRQLGSILTCSNESHWLSSKRKVC